MSTTTPAPESKPVLPETLTEEHHELLTRSWELPAYERPTPPAPPAPPVAPHRALLVGLLCGALGLAVGAGLGYWAGNGQPTETASPIVVSTTVPTVPGYSVTHDSRIIEPVGYSATHDSRIADQGFSLESYQHDSRIIEPVGYSATHDSRIADQGFSLESYQHDSRIEAAASVTHDDSRIVG